MFRNANLVQRLTTASPQMDLLGLRSRVTPVRAQNIQDALRQVSAFPATKPFQRTELDSLMKLNKLTLSTEYDPVANAAQYKEGGKLAGVPVRLTLNFLDNGTSVKVSKGFADGTEAHSVVDFLAKPTARVVTPNGWSGSGTRSRLELVEQGLTETNGFSVITTQNAIRPLMPKIAADAGDGLTTFETIRLKGDNRLVLERQQRDAFGQLVNEYQVSNTVEFRLT